MITIDRNMKLANHPSRMVGYHGKDFRIWDIKYSRNGEDRTLPVGEMGLEREIITDKCNYADDEGRRLDELIAYYADDCADLCEVVGSFWGEDAKERRYAIRYRGCYKGDQPSTDDPNVGEIYSWTMNDILAEINRDRSPNWTDYDETDWREGLDWTNYEPINDNDNY